MRVAPPVVIDDSALAPARWTSFVPRATPLTPRSGYRIRRTVASLTPISAAMVRVLQWVALAGDA